MRIAPPSPGRIPAPPAPRTAAPAKKFTAVLNERALGAPSAVPSRPPKPPASLTRPGPTTSPVRAMLERTVGAEKQVDALLEAAARGKTFTPAQLLAMQATVARYSQTVEVVSRAADRLVGAAKQ